MKKALIILSIALLFVCLSLAYSLSNSRRECHRLSDNQRTLLEECRLYETEAKESAASVERLLLTKDELERNYQSVCEEAKQLGIKVKRLQAAAQTATNTNISVTPAVRDSIIYRYKDRYFDTVKVFEWSDPPWAYVSGIIDSSSVDLDIAMVDTIKQFIHRVPRRFLFIRFGTKAIRQDVVNSNPYSNVVFTEYIELTK